MEVKQIEFQFKGARSYIQGPDIFNALTNINHPERALENIRFSLHDFVRTPVCRIYQAYSREDISGVPDIRARCQFELNRTSHWMALVQCSGDDLTGHRTSYDEDRVISICRMQDKTIVLNQSSPFSFIETIVSMNKHMHQLLYPDAAGKWIFTRADLEHGCDARENLALTISHNMNYRLTKSDIVVDGKKIGNLFFSLVKS